MGNVLRVLAGFLVTCALISCAFINLEQIDLSLLPANNGDIIGADQDMSVGFSIAPNHDEAQRLVSVTQGNSNCPGDFRWEGQRLFFKPVPPLAKGIRAVLKVAGSMHSQDGRSFTLNQARFFSVGPETAQTCLFSWSIGDETVSEKAKPLVLRFSRPMDQNSYLAGFKISPALDLDRTWNAGATELSLVPKSSWVNLVTYHWELSPDFLDANGQRLLETVKHGFYVELDSIAPVINRIMVARPVEGAGNITYLGLSENLDTLKIGDCLMVETSEAMQTESLSGSIRLTPSLKGAWLTQSDGQVWQNIFVPGEPFVSGTRYQLSIADKLSDLSGNPIDSSITRFFTPAIPYAQISSIVLGDGAGTQLALNSVDFAAIQTIVPSDPLNIITVRLEFDLGEDGQVIEAADQAQFASLPEFTHVFPNSAMIREPSLISVSFIGGSTCLLSYAGFSKGDVSEGPHYFRFRLPGGTGGLRLKSGQCMKEDLWLVIKTS